MATISNRLTSTGNLLVNGTIDEITYTANKVTANTVFAAQFDEVTYNPSGTIINRFGQTETFSTWIATNASVTINNTSSPTGSFTASKLTEDSTNAIHRLLTSLPFVNGITYTMSTYAKAAERRNFVIYHEEGASVNRAGVQANLQTGTVVNYTTGTGTVNSTFISNVGNGWYRFGFSFTASANATVNITYRLIDNAGNFTYTGDGTSGLYVWGAQFEQGSSATIYQPIAAANTLVASTTVRKIDQAANYYIQGQFDELTGAPVIDSNLKFWIDAAQSNSYSGSGATWYDISTSQSNVTLYNSPTYSSSVTGGNIKFTPSSTQYGDTATNLGNMPKWTAEAWVKVNASLTGQVTSAVTNQYNLSNALNYSIGTNKSPTDYNLCVGFFDGAWHNTTGFVPTLDTWYQVVGTYDGTTLTQYVNGTANGSAVSYTGTASSGGVTRIARRWDDTTASTNLFPGDIAVVRIYNRALTADEVSQNFNAHRRRFNI